MAKSGFCRRRQRRGDEERRWEALGGQPGAFQRWQWPAAWHAWRRLLAVNGDAPSEDWGCRSHEDAVQYMACNLLLAERTGLLEKAAHTGDTVLELSECR